MIKENSYFTNEGLVMSCLSDLNELADMIETNLIEGKFENLTALCKFIETSIYGEMNSKWYSKGFIVDDLGSDETRVLLSKYKCNFEIIDDTLIYSEPECQLSVDGCILTILIDDLSRE